MRIETDPLVAPERIALLEQRERDLSAEIHAAIVGIWQTELLQWHSKLFYRLHSPAPEDVDGCQKLLAALDLLRLEGETHLRDWRWRRDAARSLDGKVCIERLEQLLNVIERFRHCVLDHRVVLVTRETKTSDAVQHWINDLRAVDASVIRGQTWDPWDTAAKIEAQTARLDARRELGDATVPEHQPLTRSVA